MDQEKEKLSFSSTDSFNLYIKNISNSSLSEEEKDSMLGAIFSLLHRDTEKFKEIKPGIETAKFIHQVIDKAIADEKAVEKISCRDGCAYCCYMDVGCTQMEVDYALDYIQKNNIPIDWKSNLNKKACPFLKDNRCSIYKARPSTCRLYHVISDPEECNIDVNPDGLTLRYTFPQGEIVCSAAFTAYGHVNMRDELKKRSAGDLRNGSLDGLKS